MSVLVSVIVFESVFIFWEEDNVSPIWDGRCGAVLNNYNWILEPGATGSPGTKDH